MSMTTIIYTEQSFDSSFRGTYKGYHIDNRLITSPNILSPVFLKYANFNKLNTKFINPIRLGLEMQYSIIYLNKLIESVYIRHSKLHDIIDNITELNIEKENIIHVMKRIIDDIIMILCIKNDNEYYLKHNKIRILSIGDLNKYPELANKIKKDLKYEHFYIILNVINNLHNSYKHSCMLNQSRQELAKDGVALFSYWVPYGDLNNIFYLRHNLMHIIIGFSDFLLAFFDVELHNREYKLLEIKRELILN